MNSKKVVGNWLRLGWRRMASALSFYVWSDDYERLRNKEKGWKTMINGLNGIVNGQSGTERDRNRESEILEAADRQTDWVGGPWAHLQCMLPCINTTAIPQEKDRERKRTSIDESLLSIHPLFIVELDLAWMKERKEEKGERRKGMGCFRGVGSG